MSKFSKSILVFLLCTIIISCKDFQTNNLEFNQNEWKKADFRVRGRMYGSLLSQKILDEKKQNEIIQILGKPEEEGVFSGSNEVNTSYVKYAVDLGSIFEGWIQRYFLIIIFDNTGMVVKYSIIDS